MNHNLYTQKRDEILLKAVSDYHIEVVRHANGHDSGLPPDAVLTKAAQAIDSLFLEMIDTQFSNDRDIGAMGNTARRTRGNRNHLRAEQRAIVKGKSR